jgi:aspartyl-tRNA(Asn)/glutamyl-tRNA(Gln) amidotransferase subunit A
LHAFNTVMHERALASAAAVDRHPRRANVTARGRAGRAERQPVHRAVSGPLLRRRFSRRSFPPFDATVVKHLEAGWRGDRRKTNCDAFAMGSSTENSAFGVTRNPWALEPHPGGSSGGSAVAVAAEMVPLALGSDTEVRFGQPAALCGIVGLKPTYGRVSRYGCWPFASSLDQIGPLTRKPWRRRAGALGDRRRRPGRRDQRRRNGCPTRHGFECDLRTLTIGVPRALVEEGVDAEVAAAFKAALRNPPGSRRETVDVVLPYAGAAIPVYYLVATAEASSNLARYDGVRYGYRATLPARATAQGGMHDDLRAMYGRTRAEGFGAEVKRRIMLGTYVLSAGYYDAYYLKAQQVRTLIRQDYDRAFEHVDVVAMPTSPTAAFKLGERVSDPLQMYLADVFTVSANLAGLPAVSVPCGFTTANLPIGLQLTGRMFDEATLLAAADTYERHTEWWKRHPTL